MASIPIHNETEYTLTDDMTKQIIRDAQEHFGEDVRSIRVQYGIERHAFNARTGKRLWSSDPSDIGGPVFVAPVVVNGTVLAGAWDGRLHAWKR